MSKYDKEEIQEILESPIIIDIIEMLKEEIQDEKNTLVNLDFSKDENRLEAIRRQAIIEADENTIAIFEDLKEELKGGEL